MVTDTDLPRLGRWYVGMAASAGLILIGLSLFDLFTGAIDPRWLAFAALTVLSASATIKVPALPARISISETFVFTSLLVFGPEAGALTVAIDGLVASLWEHRRGAYAVYKTIFNVAGPALALWAAATICLYLAGIPPLVQRYTPVEDLLPPLFLIAATYFAMDTWMMALAIGLQTRVPATRVWSSNFLWIAINYLGGASVTVLVILLYNQPIGNSVALGVIIPLLTIFYLLFKVGMGRAEDSITHLTALKQAAEQRAALEDQLRESQKMESVGRLAAGVAHDFNNLLTPIIGYADILVEDGGPDALRREELLQIKHAAERARDLTRQLLAFGRKQMLTLRPVDLRVVVTEFERLLRRMVREDIRIEVHRPDSLALVRADTGQIEQVLMNLAVNAQDAMPDGGVLTITLGETEVDDGRIAVEPGLPLGSCVTLAVRDTGCGMSAETLARVYEPFFTTKERGKGTGLGLSTVYGIVKQHGGHLIGESAPGKGSCFTIYLPTTHADLEAAAPGMAIGSAATHGSEHILVVEDNEAVGRMTRMMLEREGYRVALASSGQAALALARTTSPAIDLLLSDIVLPDVSGRELRERLLAAQPGLRVVDMSGYADDVIAHRGVLDGGVRFLQKPFSPQALTQKVREALDAPPAYARRD